MQKIVKYMKERLDFFIFIFYYYIYSLLYENFPAQIYQLHVKWVHKDVVLNLEYNHEVESTRNS